MLVQLHRFTDLIPSAGCWLVGVDERCDHRRGHPLYGTGTGACAVVGGLSSKAWLVGPEPFLKSVSGDLVVGSTLRLYSFFVRSTLAKIHLSRWREMQRTV